MANDLETMRARLRSQLHDVDDDTWNAGEKDDILLWAVRRLNQRLSRPLDPTAANQNITIVTDTYYYAINSDITSIAQVEFLDSSGDSYGLLETGWDVVGDIITGNAKLHVASDVVSRGGSLRLLADGRYELATQTASQTSAIPDDYVTLVLAMARAESYRRMVGDRARFKQWQVQNQVEDISVNELIQMVSNAERQADDEWSLLKRWPRPVRGRV